MCQFSRCEIQSRRRWQDAGTLIPGPPLLARRRRSGLTFDALYEVRANRTYFSPDASSIPPRRTAGARVGGEKGPMGIRRDAAADRPPQRG